MDKGEVKGMSDERLRRNYRNGLICAGLSLWAALAALL